MTPRRSPKASARAGAATSRSTNTASKDQLETLPGMTSAEAERVIAGRPYDDPSDLLTRRILSKPQYDKISDRVTAKK